MNATHAHTHRLLNGIPSERLTEFQEQALARDLMRKNLSKYARQSAMNMLILHAMWEAFFYARQCCRKKLPDDEIYSLSYDALCRAAENFKPGRVRFFAYSKVYVRGAICKEWKKKDVVKNSSSHESLMLEVDDTVGHWVEDIHGLGCFQKADPTKKLEPDEVEPDFSSINSREVWGIIEPVIKSRLNKYEQRVLRMAYQEGLNFQEIGDKLGVSRAAVHAEHERAIKRLRCVLSHKRELLLGHK